MQERTDLTNVALAVCQAHQMNFRGKVGEGAFKQTFHVEKENGISLALKVYNLNAGADRIIREVQAMLKCSHPSIARIYKIDTISFGGSQFLYAMEEFLGGGTLQEMLVRGLPLDRPTVLSLGHHLLSAIEHIAALGLVHRDIKPQNVLFRDKGNSPVITDFGIVRDLNATSLTATWAVSGPGTPFFAAPEQMNNEKHMTDWRTDQFSCGILLSICALGIHPYGNGDDETLRAMAERKGTTKEFKEATASFNYPVMCKMVEPWPVKRYRNIKSLIRDWDAQGE